MAITALPEVKALNDSTLSESQILFQEALKNVFVQEVNASLDGVRKGFSTSVNKDFASATLWSSATSYVVGNIVYLNGVFYICKTNNSNNNPSTSTTYWTKSTNKDFIKTGYLKQTVNPIEAGYLSCNGNSFDPSAYPALANISSYGFDTKQIATLNSASPSRVSISPDCNYIAASSQYSPYGYVFKRTGNTFSSITLGTALPSECRSCCWDNTSTYLAFGVTSSPYLYIYKRSGDTFTKLANPATLPPTVISSMQFSHDGLYLACITSQTSPYLHIYKRNGDTFTKLSNPSSLPANYQISNVGFISNSTSTYTLVIQYGSTSVPFIYNISNDVITYNTQLSSVLSYSRTSAYSSVLNHFALAEGNGGVRVFSSLSPYSAVTTLSDAGGTIQSIKYTADGKYLVAVTSGSYEPVVYKISGNTYTKTNYAELFNFSISNSQAYYDFDIAETTNGNRVAALCGISANYLIMLTGYCKLPSFQSTKNINTYIKTGV